MMGTIPGDVRGGLLELFYGVYNKCGRRVGVGGRGAGASGGRCRRPPPGARALSALR